MPGSLYFLKANVDIFSLFERVFCGETLRLNCEEYTREFYSIYALYIHNNCCVNMKLGNISKNIYRNKIKCVLSTVMNRFRKGDPIHCSHGVKRTTLGHRNLLALPRGCKRGRAETSRKKAVTLDDGVENRVPSQLSQHVVESSG